MGSLIICILPILLLFFGPKIIGQYGTFSKNTNNFGFSSLEPNLTNNSDPGGILSNWSKKPKILDYSDYCSKPGLPGLPWPAPGRPAPSARQARRPPTRRTRASNLASPNLPEKRSWAIILKLDVWPSSILNEKALDLPFWSWACGPASFLIGNHACFWTWMSEHWTCPFEAGPSAQLHFS